MNKTAEKKTKVVGTRQLTDVEYSFMQTVLGELPWIDLVGIDIAVSDKGLLLIEVNRAPQFKRYNEIIGRNIVADFFDQIAEIEA